MKRRGSIWLVVLLTALLSACASTVEPETAEVRFTAPEGKARIYFYRTGVPFLIALQPVFVVNAKAVGRAVHDEVFYRDAFPGRYQVFMASDPETILSFTLEEGEVKFVKAVIDFSITGSRISAALVEEKTGRQEIGDRPILEAEG
jgi:hypothetical protein